MTYTGAFEYLKRKVLTTSTCSDSPRRGNLEISEITTKQSQLQQAANLQASIEHISLPLMSNIVENLPETQEDNDRIMSKIMRAENYTYSHTEELYEDVKPQLLFDGEKSRLKNKMMTAKYQHEELQATITIYMMIRKKMTELGPKYCETMTKCRLRNKIALNVFRQNINSPTAKSACISKPENPPI